VLVLAAVPLFAGAALADTASTSMNVNATVTDGGNCIVNAGDMDFGATDGSARALSASLVVVDCASGIEFLVSFDAGLHYDPAVGTRQVENASGQPIAYFLTDETGTFELGDNCFANTYAVGGCVSGMSIGDPIPINVGGILSAADETITNIYTPGTTYSDSVSVQVEF
jgi:spore coat protein U-like protein